jgi:ACS family glucarate transporter-like MFS transporter
VAWVWYLLARDTPNEHPGVSPGERAWIAESGVSRDAEPEPPSSLWHLLKNRVVWYLIMSYLMLGYVAYIYLAWFYIYLVDVRHFTLLTGSYVAAAPFVAMAITCPLGGWLTDRICRRYGARAGRSGIGLTGMISTALFLSLGAVTPDPYLSVAELSLGAGTLYLTVGAYWSGAIALSNKNSGALTGLMNMGANIGGTLSPTFTPWLGTKLGWPFALLFAAGVAGLGGILWFGIRTPD